MCGIFGVFSKELPRDIDRILNNSLFELKHRGPDDSGTWCNFQSGIAFGHTRLSILDLTSAGHQPMTSPSERYVISFNGEIYNHLLLRKNINKMHWKGHSDTETLLACFDVWGVKKTLENISGMFALALWDKKEGKLILARDRFGEKPLYYGYVSNMFVFSSELNPIRVMPNFKGDINRNALSNYLRYLYVPTPECIFEGLYKLKAGSWIEISTKQVSNYIVPKPKIYWSAVEQTVLGERDNINFKSDKDAVDRLEVLLGSSVSRQMLSDVPLGAFLSGGVDSSTIVALMQSMSARRIDTFSIGFYEDEYNEAKYAKSIAKHIGTNHTELYIKSSDAIELIPSLSHMYDEPFADSSQIPTFFVSKLAREKVTVSLSGDGGDEIFGGYNRYFFANGPWKSIKKIPLPVRSMLSGLMTSISPVLYDRIYKLIFKFLYSTGTDSVGNKVHKIASILSCSNEKDLYHRLTQLCDPNKLVLGAGKNIYIDDDWDRVSNPISKMMAADTTNYLSDDILLKVDRAAMSVSLETRIPFLDHRIYEFASRLPMNYKFRDGTGKWILRELLYRHVPKKLIERPKMGFGIPIDDWLRGPLKDWACDMLNSNRIKEEGYLNQNLVKRIWSNHVDKSVNSGLLLWGILMFESWLGGNKK